MKLTSAYTKLPFLVKLKVHSYDSSLVVSMCKAESVLGAGTLFVSSRKILIQNRDGKCWISRSHSRDYKGYCLQRCNVVYSDRSSPTFQKKPFAQTGSTSLPYLLRFRH
jgi:hypothetical protein